MAYPSGDQKDNPKTTPVLKEVVEDSYKRLIAPAIEREIRSELTEKQKTEPFMYLEKSGAASYAAADHGQGGSGMGSCLPYRM